MKKKMTIFLLLTFFLTACGSAEESQESNNNSSNQSTSEEIVMPEVKVQFKDQPITPQQETTVQATVTQGPERVEDAEYVEFEIWQDAKGQESSEKVKAEHQGNGIYAAPYTFSSEGTYQVIAHTQARDMHVMPQVEVTIGEASDQHTEQDTHNHGDTKSKFMVHFVKDTTFRAGEQSTLITHINQMETPFQNGMVQFEISSDQMKKHQYVDAKETEAGKYTASYTFSAAGQYTVTIHYEKPEQDIHGHQEQTIQVAE